MGRVFRKIWRATLTAGAVLALAACTTAQRDAAPHRAESVPSHAGLGLYDMRAEFRHDFCRQLPVQADCAQTLRFFPGEAALASAPPPLQLGKLARRYRLAFVPGLLAGCIGTMAMPFADTVDTLRTMGFDARIVSIEGRGSSEHNADLIARQLSRAESDPRPWIVFGYSKGLPDVLEALVRYPSMAGHVGAVVSYAGAAGGSRLAEDVGRLSTALLEHVPLPGCQAGDGADIHALRRDVRHAWWRDHQAQVRVPIYSIVAAPQPQRVSVPLRKTYASLSATDGPNDGQLATADALAPGSRLLAYVDADHWAIAIPLSRQFPLLGNLFIDDVPRTELVLAALQVISRHSPSSHESVHHP